MSIASWFEIGRVREAVGRFKPDLLHVLWAYGAGTYGARSEFHPFLLSPWGTDITVYPRNPGIKGAIQRRLVREALAKADRLTATSRFLAGEISQMDPRGRRPEIIPYGVDTSIFDPEKVTPLEFPWQDGAPEGPGTITIGFFKSLEMTYGPDILIEAIASARVKIPWIRCVMGGSGSLRERLRAMAEGGQVGERVCFPGRIPYEDMPRALAAIDIFVMPSRGEALGVAALEASAMRKPVIASEVGGIPEVVKERVTGILVGNTAEDLAREIVRLSEDVGLRGRMGAAGREFVKENYEYETLMLRGDTYYRNILSGSRE
jgi:glycosyltransferase involved in cell wall biosynthesis